jgi:hypothetical protein
MTLRWAVRIEFCDGVPGASLIMYGISRIEEPFAVARRQVRALRIALRRRAEA